MIKLTQIALIVVIIFLISACGKEYITPELPIPEKPHMPTLTDYELECVTDSTYRRVAGRDIAHKQYEKRLEAVIKSTWTDN